MMLQRLLQLPLYRSFSTRPSHFTCGKEEKADRQSGSNVDTTAREAETERMHKRLKSD